MGEQRIVLKYCGRVDPEDIQSYLDLGGFQALEHMRKNMAPEAVIEEIKASGLQGRGGAGFGCGLKWEIAGNTRENEKHLICNADESEMGTFKDRYLLTHDPFSLIEGIAIAGYAIGARHAHIYLRGEYRYLKETLSHALDQAEERGFIDHVEIEIHEGAGAYICGEESALMESIEGKRGEPRFKPPFPPTHGLWGKPTIINNVETLMNIPHIIRDGADRYRAIGTEGSKGTKVFSVSGDVDRPGVYELTMGSRLRELVVDLAGAGRIKMVQVGGASGSIVPSERLDIPLSYETVLGSGGVTVFDETRDVIDILSQDMVFLAEESCGKCTPCREGTEVMVEILERLHTGEGVPEDIVALESLSGAMKQAAICGLGQSAPIPVLDALKYFGDEFKERIKQAQLLRSVQGNSPRRGARQQRNL